MYFKINEAGEVVEVAAKYKEVPGAGLDPSIWAKQPIGAFKPGCEFRLGAGWIEHWDFPSFAFVEKMAASASKLTGNQWLPVDRGDCVSPRFDLIEAPKVGDECSKGFNGDYYPVGKVVRIGKDYKTIDVDGPRGKLRFYRRKLSEAWIQAGGTWGLIKGVHDRMNPEF